MHRLKHMKRSLLASEILGLTTNERDILKLLPTHPTPLKITEASDIPRPTVYVTLEKLAQRGLVQKRREGKKRYWVTHIPKETKQNISNYKLHLDAHEEKKDSLQLSEDTQIKIHKGKAGILGIFLKMIKTNTGQNMLQFQGNNIANSWAKVIGAKDINKINKLIKKEKTVSEIVASLTWIKSQVNLFGRDWARDFEGRTLKMNVLDEKYLDFESQIFISGDSAYIFHMPEVLAIEILNTSIVKMLKSMILFIQDNSRAIDGNALVRGMIDSMLD